jgi:hypothetical protein
MTKYYEVIAKHEGTPEVLYGSFLKDDCLYEVEAERDSWKEQGYKGIKISVRETTDTPDIGVYGELVTPKELWLAQAPSFNFELDEDDLLEKALESGYVTVADKDNDLYLVNKDY